MKRDSYRLISIVVGTVVVLALATVLLRPEGGEPLNLDPPQADLSGVEDTVATVIRAALEAVRESPESAEAWGRLGMVYDAHEFEREAAECYVRAASMDPNDVRWAYFGAVVKDDLGHEDAAAWYGRALDFRPRYVPLLLRAAEYELEHGDPQRAKELYERTIRESPTIPHSYAGLARVAMMNDDLQQARAHAERGLEIDAYSGELHGILAEILRLSGEDSLAAMERSVADQVPFRGPVPDELAAEVGRLGVGSHWAMQRGNVYLMQRRFADAERELRRAAEARPDAQVYTNLGVALHRRGRFEEAVEWHERAIELAPEYAEAHSNLGAVLLELNRPREAMPHLDRARELDPSSPGPDMVVANFRASRREWGAAIEAIRSALERSPDNVRVLQALADLLQTVPDATYVDAPEARRLAERANELLGGRDPALLFLLAQASLARMDSEGAVEYALNARRLARLAGRTPLANQITQFLQRLGVS